MTTKQRLERLESIGNLAAGPRPYDRNDLDTWTDQDIVYYAQDQAAAFAYYLFQESHDLHYEDEHEDEQLVERPGLIETDISRAAYWIKLAWQELLLGPESLAWMSAINAWPIGATLAEFWPKIEAAHGRADLLAACELDSDQLATLIDHCRFLQPLHEALHRENTKHHSGSAHFMLFPETAGAKQMTYKNGRWRYQIERYAPRSWAIRDTKTDQIVGYPGPSYLSVARSWLKWECGETGQTVETLAAFGELIDAAADRLAAAIEASGRTWEREHDQGQESEETE